MNLDIAAQLPAHFSPSSRVWIYQCDRTFTETEKPALEEMMQQFVRSWRSHGAVVSGFARLFFSRFVVLMADETAATVSGCSTDSSVQLIREIEKQFHVGLFDRQQLAFVVNDEIKTFPLARLTAAVREGLVSRGDLFFNNTVTTLNELRQGWILPADQSWLQQRPAFAAISG
jgi:hypothetical protein